MATRAELLDALKNADAAGDTAGAQQLADAIDALDQQTSNLGELSGLTQNFASGGATEDQIKDAISQARDDRWRQEYADAPALAKPFIALDDVLTTGANSLSFGLIPKAAAGARSLVTGNSYDEELANAERLAAQSRARMGNAAAPTEIGASLLLPAARIGKGMNWLGRAGVRGLEGAGYGALSGLGGSDIGEKGTGWQDVAGDLLSGTALGGALNVGTGGLLDAIGGAVKGAPRIWSERGQSVNDKTWNAVSRQLRDAGLTQEAIDDAAEKLGKEGVIADILPDGPKTLLKAGRTSPKAAKIAEKAFDARDAKSVERIAASFGPDASPEGRDVLAKSLVPRLSNPTLRAKALEQYGPEFTERMASRLDAERQFAKTRQGSLPSEQGVVSNLWDYGKKAALPTLASTAAYGIHPLVGAAASAAGAASPLVSQYVEAMMGRAPAAIAKANVLTSPIDRATVAPVSAFEGGVDTARDFLAKLALRAGLLGSRQQMQAP